MADLRHLVPSVTPPQTRHAPWTEQALCAQPKYRPKQGDDPWFSDREVDKNYAKEICKQCPILQACQENSVNETTGIWGGIERKERPVVSTPRVEAEFKEIVEDIANGVPARDIAQKLGVTGEAIYARAKRRNRRDVQTYFTKLMSQEHRERAARREVAA